MGRRRYRLVPHEGIEIFEIRIALYFDGDGSRQVATSVSSPEEADLLDVDLVELLGALAYGKTQLRETYAPESA